VIVAVWVPNAIGTMRISYCQNIKRSPQTVLKVRSMFHTCSHLDLVFVFFHLRCVFLCFSRTDVLLWAKAEVVTETRQVFRPVGICCSGWLLGKDRYSQAKLPYETR
jgi:hypothetical protein